MSIEVGTCPDSWGVWFADDPLQTPWNRFLDEVAEAGYSWLELGPYGYLPTDLSVLRRELDSRGLRVAASFVMRPLEDAQEHAAILREAEQVGELLASLGARYFVLIDDVYRDLRTGQQLAPPRLDGDAWKRLTETTNELGRLVRERFGLQLVYHHHADSHVERREQIDALLADTDPSVVGLLLDFGHAEYRGVDSLAVLRAHHDRIPYLHLKTVDPAVRERVEAEDAPFGTAVAWRVFAEVGTGVPTLEDLTAALKEVGYDGILMVEQDLYPCDFDEPLPIAIRTRARLVNAGLI
jgi:inosose dehydratase